jgi:hypothetical protein
VGEGDFIVLDELTAKGIARIFCEVVWAGLKAGFSFISF